MNAPKNAAQPRRGDGRWSTVVKPAPHKGLYDPHPDVDDDRGRPIKEYLPYVSPDSRTGKPITASAQIDTLEKLRAGAAETLENTAERLRKIEVGIFAKVAAENPDIRTVDLRIRDLGLGELAVEGRAYDHRGELIEETPDVTMLSDSTLARFLSEQRDEYENADEVTISLVIDNWVKNHRA
ncbi:hypothetical protein [Aeromicrobium sp. 179-A 4D2 NHS]|uniref:hypothetical protein n=1 Tax=Aeromicrobium sp. 179-A 4D2 NHS TaxID=3142375 RepID=UPI00399EEAC4